MGKAGDLAELCDVARGLVRFVRAGDPAKIDGRDHAEGHAMRF
jgi:hypothetical protein